MPTFRVRSSYIRGINQFYLRDINDEGGVANLITAFDNMVLIDRGPDGYLTRSFRLDIKSRQSEIAVWNSE